MTAGVTGREDIDAERAWRMLNRVVCGLRLLGCAWLRLGCELRLGCACAALLALEEG